MCPCRIGGDVCRAEPATARRQQTASPTTTSPRGGAWRGTCSATARRRSSGTWASTCRGAAINGIYADANPAAAHGQRVHPDLDRHGRQPQRGLRPAELRCAGQRVAETSAAGRPRSPVRTARGTAATRSAWTRRARRSVWPPPSADAGKQGIPADVQAYCDVYGDTLLEGWGKRRSEWQFGLGIQHELLPRLSAEVTYNRRKYSNLTVTDQLGVGCDRFNGALDAANLSGRILNYSSRSTTSSRSWRRAIQTCPAAAAIRSAELPTRRRLCRPAARPR